jgi:hypothetical protein
MESDRYKWLGRLPYNEFSEVCTGDMPSADRVIHYLENPEKSDFPDAARRQAKWWKGRKDAK